MESEQIILDDEKIYEAAKKLELVSLNLEESGNNL